MALSKETAGKIIDSVAVDVNCRKAIDPNPNLGFLNPLTGLWLEATHLAGAVRNIPLVLKSIALNKKPEDDAEMTNKLCIGIVAVTVKAIIGAVRQGKLPGVHTAGSIHRVHWGTDHDATWIRMEDDSEYVFDWHATLKIYDPVINKADEWVKAQLGINYVLFSGFK
jgi:hypothetical protein